METGAPTDEAEFPVGRTDGRRPTRSRSQGSSDSIPNSPHSLPPSLPPSAPAAPVGRPVCSGYGNPQAAASERGRAMEGGDKKTKNVERENGFAVRPSVRPPSSRPRAPRCFLAPSALFCSCSSDPLYRLLSLDRALGWVGGHGNVSMWSGPSWLLLVLLTIPTSSRLIISVPYRPFRLCATHFKTDYDGSKLCDTLSGSSVSPLHLYWTQQLFEPER